MLISARLVLEICTKCYVILSNKNILCVSLQLLQLLITITHYNYSTYTEDHCLYDEYS